MFVPSHCLDSEGRFLQTIRELHGESFWGKPESLTFPHRASRYRYDPDRRSRSPRDRERSPDRFDRPPQFGDGDRRRSSAEMRPGPSGYQQARDYNDPMRREPPRGPKALIDAPNGPRGGFGGDLRGRGRGVRGGRAWPPRDDSRDRGREREPDFRDRYRDDRSRERDRDRDRDRDWRDPRDYRSRRSPVGRVRSPNRDFRDRDREPPLGVDAERSRRGSRDGGPGSAGSSSSDPQLGLPPFRRGGSFNRGRGRGGRDWGPDRGPMRPAYDDRNDRFPRSRSQEGRWARDRDERDRGDRYAEADVRRDPRDERDRPDRELFRAKMEGRNASAQDGAVPGRDASPPPVAPSAPAFGTVQHRTPSLGDRPDAASSVASKAPPTAPRAFNEAAGSNQAKPAVQDSPAIPSGPRAHQQQQQQQQQRPSSRQWINPTLRQTPESPKFGRAQTFTQQRPTSFQRDGSRADTGLDDRRPRSSDANSQPSRADYEARMRTHHSAEPGEITSVSEKDYDHHDARASEDVKKPVDQSREAAFGDGTRTSLDRPASQARLEQSDQQRVNKKGPGKIRVPLVRFALPPKVAVPEPDSESDDDEDMDDYFNSKIQNEEAELSKYQAPKLPHEVIARFAAMSHGSMVKILTESEGLVALLGDLPEGARLPGESATEKPVQTQRPSSRDRAEQLGDESEAKRRRTALASDVKALPKTEDMEVDGPSKASLPQLERPSIPQTVEGEDTVPRRPSSAGVLASHKDVVTEGRAMSLAPNFAAIPFDSVEDGSKVASTPSQVPDDEDEDETESEDEALIDVEVVRRYIPTPPLDDLPDYGLPSWDKDEEFLASLKTDAGVDGFIAEHLTRLDLEKHAEIAQVKHLYKEQYQRYADFTLSQDPIAVKSREKFSVSAPIIETPPPGTPEPKPEGRGTGRRFATERDLERVLQASMREDEERKEREMRAQKEKYRSDKEAVIPDMCWTEMEQRHRQNPDVSGLLDSSKLAEAWHILPPVNNFTEEESDLFEKRYLELPKQWGKVAEVIPGRDFGTCIQFYYMMKKDLNLKDKLKRQPKKRKKGRGKQRSSALVSELGNGDNETEDNQETGENGERRRPRRAAAPTWGFEQPNADADGSSSGTGRRSATASKNGELGEKIDGRRGRRKAKDKEPKASRASQNLAVPSAGGSGKRSRSGSRALPNDVPANRLAPDQQRGPGQFEQPLAPVMAQPFANQPQPSLSMPMQDRPQHLTTPGLNDVMGAPSLRPEPPPPPQPAMTTFNLAQPQQERKAPTQASSYWSVSETNDFPLLLKSFGSDWTAIAAHMGTKTPVMVKNYFVRQKDQTKPEWETFVKMADEKRSRGEKRPEPPQPTAGGRSRRYDTSIGQPSRPLAVAPNMDLHPDQGPAPKMEGAPTQARGQPFSNYGAMPLAQAAPAQPGQQPLVMQTHGGPAASQAMSPGTRPLRAPLQPFGFPERERDPLNQQRVPLAQKGPGGPVAEHRPLAAAQPIQPAPTPDPNAHLERQRMEIDLQMRDVVHDRDRDRKRERDRVRSGDFQTMRPKMEADRPPPQHHYEPYGHRHHSSHSQSPREPLSLSRPSPQESLRATAAAPYQGPMHHPGGQPGRPFMNEPPVGQSPPLAPPSSRPMSSLQQRPISGSMAEQYGGGLSQPPTPVPSSSTPRPPEPRKTSSIMSLLNDDPPPPPKRVSDVSGTPGRPTNTPPPQGIGRPPSGPPTGPQMRRDPDPYSPYGRAPSTGPSSMPALKPSYSGSPQSQPIPGSRAAMGMPVDSPGAERDYYRQGPYQQSSGRDSPQAAHRYQAPGQPPQGPYQPKGSYLPPYGGGPPRAGSPPQQYPPRGREMPPGGRDGAWPPQQQQPSGWPTQAPPKSAQNAPPAQQAWPTPHAPSTPKPPTPAQSWGAAPPPAQPHPLALRDERAPMYGSSQPPPGQQPGMQGRYAPPLSRGPEPGPPPGQGYPRYASTPGPGPGQGPPPRDPRDMPGRSYTPVGYDARGPPPPGPPYGGPDPREMQMRDGRDPRDSRDQRDLMGRSLRPHEYDRHPDQYRR